MKYAHLVRYIFDAIHYIIYTCHILFKRTINHSYIHSAVIQKTVLMINIYKSFLKVKPTMSIQKMRLKYSNIDQNVGEQAKVQGFIIRPPTTFTVNIPSSNCQTTV